MPRIINPVGGRPIIRTANEYSITYVKGRNVAEQDVIVRPTVNIRWLKDPLRQRVLQQEWEELTFKDGHLIDVKTEWRDVEEE